MERNPKNQLKKEEIAIRIGKLISKKLSGSQLSQREKNDLEQWLAQNDPKGKLLPYYTASESNLHSIQNDLAAFDNERGLQRLKRRLLQKRTTRMRRIALATAAAASLLVFLYIGLLEYGPGQHIIGVGKASKTEIVDLSPGGNKATLVLADGRTIDLSTQQEAVIMDAQGLRYSNGSAVLEGDSAPLPDGTVAILNRLVTPKGGQYRITLPDGSQVWLNAASTLTYPSRFEENTRIVELSGEAYFQVKKQTSKTGTNLPFIVKTVGQEIEVLGTEFNVSAYQDDGITLTTLVSGQVEVSDVNTAAKFILTPGEQTQLSGQTFTKQLVDVSQNVAWKNGFFQFKRADIQTVMRQIGRWYNVDVVFESMPEDIKITGKAYRHVSASQVLEILQHLDIPFRIEKDTIVITKRRRGN